MTTISAVTVLSSDNAGTGKRLDTQLWTYPRWIHAEGRTHRSKRIAEDMEILIPTPSPMEESFLSRNAASSRAIPVVKMVEAIRADPAVPLFWGKNVAGMQAKEELGPVEQQKAYDTWMRAMEAAIAYATDMCNLGIDDEHRVIGAHKQIVNRMLEPYMHIKVLASATEWVNFLELRDHEDAEPHIAMLARAVRAELEKPAMQVLKAGQWHMPFVQTKTISGVQLFENPIDSSLGCLSVSDAADISVACCASTSYRTIDDFEMTPTRAKSITEKLRSKPLHASPFEHLAIADEITEAGFANPDDHRNFRGFRQYRAIVERDERP